MHQNQLINQQRSLQAKEKSKRKDQWDKESDITLLHEEKSNLKDNVLLERQNMPKEQRAAKWIANSKVINQSMNNQE